MAKCYYCGESIDTGDEVYYTPDVISGMFNICCSEECAKTIIESDIENLKACIDVLINYKIEKEVF